MAAWVTSRIDKMLLRPTLRFSQLASATIMSCAYLISTTEAISEPNAYIGHWRQIHSVGGECDMCALSIERQGREYRVEASNEWKATLWPVDHADRGKPPMLQGIGEWSAFAHGRLAGRTFRLALINDEGILRLLMLFSNAPGEQSQQIAAEYILGTSG